MPDAMSTRDSDEEIDLLGVLETLWAGKSLILASSVLPVLVALAILLNSSPKMDVTARYSILVNPISCRAKSCEHYISRQIDFISDGEWVSVDDGTAVTATTENPKSAVEYESDFAVINRTIRALMLKEAAETEFLIENEMFIDMCATEAISKTLIQAKQVRLALKGEEMPLAFGSISTVSQRNFPVIISATALCGAAFGSVLVLFRKVFRDRLMAAEQIGL